MALKELWQNFKDNLKDLLELGQIIFPVQEFDLYLSEISPAFVKFKVWFKNLILKIKTYNLNFQENTKDKIKTLSSKQVRQEIAKKVIKSILSLKFLLLALIIILPFKAPLEDLLELIITPIFNKIQPHVSIDICIFIGISLYCVFYLRKRIRFSDFIAFLLISTVYFYYRFVEKRWTFVDFEMYSQFKYLDIIFLLPFPYIITWIYKRLINFFSLFKAKVDSNSYSGFYLDASIGQKEADLLGRETFAETIAKKIRKTSLSESSLAIGILGEWGSGKTSFLDLIERSLDKKSIVIKFNPWINHDSKSIIKDFFNALSEELSKYHFGVSSTLKDYSDILSGVGDSNLNKILSPLLKFISQKESVASEFEKINSIIKSINKKIIIFIDDVDRLHKDEIIQVMKLIRNSANFANTTFIVTYDRNYVVSAIKEINTHAPQNYLEKVFQLEILLPNFDKIHLKNKIEFLLKDKISLKNQDELSNVLYPANETQNIIDLSVLKTLRDITRFINSFLIIYHQLQKDTLFSDLFNLEALKVKFPEVYKLIFLTSDQFVDRTITSKRYSLKYKEEYVQGISPTFRVKEDPLIKIYLEKNYSFLGIYESDIPTIMSLVHLIFDSENEISDAPVQSIIHPLSFDRYSYYRLLSSNLSSDEFNRSRYEDSYDDFHKNIDIWIEKGSSPELVENFEGIEDFENKKDFEKVITGVLHFARKKYYPIDNLYKKLIQYQKYLRLGYFTKDSYTNFIIEILENAPYPYVLEATLISYILEKISVDHINEDIFPISISILQNFRINYFKKYTQTANSFIDFNLWELYRQGTDVSREYLGNSNFKEFRTTNPEIKSIMMDLIERKIDNFLYNLIGVDSSYGDKKLYTIRNSFIGQDYFFDTYQDFKDFLNKFDEAKHPNLKEFKEFYAKYEANGYRFIEFNFSENFKEV